MDYISQKSPGTGLFPGGASLPRGELFGWPGSQPPRTCRLLFPISLCVRFRCPEDSWTRRGELLVSEEVISVGSDPAARVGVTPGGALSEEARGADRACRVRSLQPVCAPAAEKNGV